MMRNAMVALVLATALAVPAQAATFTCFSKDNYVSQNRYGTVFVTTSFGSFEICSINQTSSGVTTDVCRNWIALVLSARGMNLNVGFSFDTADPTNSNLVEPYCTTASNFSWQHRILSVLTPSQQP